MKLGRGVIYSVLKITNTVKYKIDDIICAFINVQICPTIVFQTDQEKWLSPNIFIEAFAQVIQAVTTKVFEIIL